MIRISFLLIFSFLSLAFANQKTVDSYISLALEANEDKLRESTGEWSCGPILSEGKFRAQDKDFKVAQTRSLLLCMIDGCKNIGKRLREANAKSNLLPEEEYLNLLEAAGYSEDQRNKILSQRKRPDDKLNEVNCQNGGPNIRAFVYDSCFSIPLTCSKTP